MSGKEIGGRKEGCIPDWFVGDDDFGEIFSEIRYGVELVGYHGNGLFGFSLLMLVETVSKGWKKKKR